MVKIPPAMQGPQEMQFQSLGKEDPLEKGMATHSSILAWKISWIVEPGELQSMGSQRVRDDRVTEQAACKDTISVWETFFLFTPLKCFLKSNINWK